ncbi:MAG: ATP-binding protein [Acidobacteriota bacterium]
MLLSSITIVALVFSTWELLESRLFRNVDYVTLHYLYLTRGVLSSLLLALWAAWFVLRQRRRSEETLRRSQERYRGLLDASPGAVALYDSEWRVTEWNAAAERLYGCAKAEVLGHVLPTVPPEKEVELRRFLAQVESGQPVLDVETLRRDRQGAIFEVQLSLLPFREVNGQSYFLEVTADIRERVRLRQRFLEIEKLTSMGQMAAGTAHHLNTPLAALLLRVQMIRERSPQDPWGTDLERLESGLRFCQHFVRRLLEFSHRPPAEKQPQDITRAIESVLSFFAPSLLKKQARVSLDSGLATGVQVLADPSLLEALFSILLSNALDAIGSGGAIGIRCQRQSPGWIEIEIADDGCGIAAADLARVFEPFFTTKGPGSGTGLGLAIARNIARDHGGTIRLESAKQQGTSAFIALPLHQPVAQGGEEQR